MKKSYVGEGLRHEKLGLPCGPWPIVLHYIGNRVPSGMQPLFNEQHFIDSHRLPVFVWWGHRHAWHVGLSWFI